MAVLGGQPTKGPHCSKQVRNLPGSISLESRWNTFAQYKAAGSRLESPSLAPGLYQLTFSGLWGGQVSLNIITNSYGYTRKCKFLLCLA